MSRLVTGLMTGVASLCLTAGAATAQDAPELPRSSIWSAYDLGSSGYAEASGIANALQKNYKIRIRIIPAGTSIGRLLPMVTGKVRYGFLANEAYFAAEGIYDFAAPSWGPQDIRIALGRPATVGLATAGDAGVKTIADLKGKRIGFVTGNPSVNVKNEGMLAFGNMTLDDIEPVWFGSYSALKTAVLSGQIDAYSSVTTSANMREIEASPRGLYWPPFDPENKKGWDAMTGIISFVEPHEETKGAALSAEDPAWLVGYRYPMMATYADTPADEVYNFVKAIDMSFDDFKNTTSSSSNWKVMNSGRPPYDAPAHEGAIRYMKEKGWWRDEDQAWQEKRLARLERVIEAWDEAQTEFNDMRAAENKKGNKIDAEEAWPDFWAEYRKENLS